MANKTEQTVARLAQPIVEEIGCEIAEVEFQKEGSAYFLRVYLDREESSISIDDCEYVSKRLSDALDREDPIAQAYYLEVCSPGLDRKLKREKDFKRFCGSEVDVKLYAPLAGMKDKEFCGLLTGYRDGIATVEVNGVPVSVAVDQAVWIRLAVRF